MPRDPDTLVTLTSARDSFEAEVIVQALEAQGIAARAFSTAASTLQWEVAMTDPIKVQVRRADVPLARTVLREIKVESVDIDWDTVDVGEAFGPEGRAENTTASSEEKHLSTVGVVVLALIGVVIALMVVVLGEFGRPDSPG